MSLRQGYHQNVEVSVDANENGKGQIDYRGKIKLTIDATAALLFDKNKYRRSKASEIASQVMKLAMEDTKFRKGTSTDFTLSVDVSVDFNGKSMVICTAFENVHVPGFKGYWERYYNQQRHCGDAHHSSRLC